MKWFSTSQPILRNGDVNNNNRPRSNDPSSSSSLLTSLQVSSGKRPKLEIRRADAHGSHMESRGSDKATPLEIDSQFFRSQDLVSNTPTTLVPALESSDKWNGIVAEAGNSQNVEMVTPIKAMIGAKNRQCMAFIEAKGRQCVRWANEGDVYCCVHLSSRFTGNSSKKESVGPVETPMCQGTTVLGTRCKHRSLSGSSFCKKHKPYTETKPASSFSEYDKVKRKSEETFSSLETMSCNKRLMLGGDDNSSSTFQVGPVSILEKDSLVMEVEEQCIGSFVENKTDPCLDSVKRHSLYCEKHLPSWLKRARNGKTRIVSKEVFIDLLRGCSTKEEKVHLHQACELFYRLFKSIISLRNPVPKEVQFQWALSEASKVFRVKEYLTKLVSSEKERLKRIWGFGSEEEDPHPSTSSLIEEHPTPPLRELDGEVTTIRCKICSEKFPEDLTLSNHWMESHKKEAQWLFRSYACAICLDSFTNKKILETHVQERHHAQFVDHCMLLQCIACGSHFGNSDQLWMHVLSVHPSDLKLSGNVQDSLGENAENHNSVSLENDNPENLSGGGLRRFICRFCGLKFDLLPDLGRHHQAAHKGESLVTSRPSKKGIRYSAYRMKSGRLSRPKMKRSLAAASLRIRNRANASVKRRIQASKLLSSREVYNNNTYSDNNKQQSLGRLVGPECSDVAMILFSEIQKTKPRPSNFDVLSVARSVCCKVGLRTLLEEKYGELPERLYLKAAKLCSENNILVSWHLDGFVCPKGCNNNNNNNKLLEKVPRLVPCPKVSVVWPTSSLGSGKDELWVDECHYVMDSDILGQSLVQKRGVILCEDISFGKELVPIVCVGDKGCSDSHPIQSGHSEGENGRDSMPWESFTYITKPMLDQSLGLDVESLQWGCGCLRSMCCPKTCDHVYLFNNDYDDAKDIYGKPMGGRFPYDENGRIILEEGYLAYECNHLCSCSKNCPNRILQKGVQVKLEVFKKEKGWAVRAGEPILHGTFVCEYLGEVLEEQEATKRRKNRDLKAEGCLYFYDIDARNNDMKKLIEGPPKYVIDAEKYGNVSRFINHSCLPNLVKYQVLVESMDCQRAHVGLFANKDISVGEELTFDYQYEPSL